MATHCGKHDITVPDGGQCWCCEEQEINAKGPEHRAKMYRDPGFLVKRGGSNAQHQATVNAAVAQLASLSPEALERLIALANGAAPPAGAVGAKRMIA